MIVVVIKGNYGHHLVDLDQNISFKIGYKDANEIKSELHSWQFGNIPNTAQYQLLSVAWWCFFSCRLNIDKNDCKYSSPLGLPGTFWLVEICPLGFIRRDEARRFLVTGIHSLPLCFPRRGCLIFLNLAFPPPPFLLFPPL